MICNKNTWCSLIDIISDKLIEWNLSVTEASETLVLDEENKTDYTTRILVLNELNKDQLNDLKKLTKGESSDKTPNFKHERINEKELYLIVY